MSTTAAATEYSSHAPERIPESRYPRLPAHAVLPDGSPDYLRLILTSKIWLKREDLQEVFSFKIRGAYNFMASLADEERWKGVVTCSAG
ncbi:hypothetical protein OH76DRAFT_1339866 [Lentinus brumalis]|uniref:Tryptophan synthase beta chain-like PALP domain-containing protein n=1 Tax=Lentinus brumalis TaxID=2498619 RepID=A0A371DQQ8_9APHY|nr:hypothetical protein OH76DRAFT_1339866 [Polyporus brumalis]